MSNFIMMIGLPGSGKSTIAQAYSVGYGYEVVSSDAIREELYGDAATQGDPQKIFKVFHQRIEEALKAGKNCIADATNLKRKNRIEMLRLPEVKKAYKKAYFVAVPVSVCRLRNEGRKRTVPDEVITRMVNSFEPPTIEEGFNYIAINTCGFDGIYGDEKLFYETYKNYDQKNSHHSLSLGDHCLKTAKLADEKGAGPLLCMAAAIHDCGKPMTRSFKEGDENAHYYGHHCRGAYESFFFNLPYVDTEAKKIIVANLIYAHMLPFFNGGMEKLEKEYSHSFIEEVKLLHEADKEAK